MAQTASVLDCTTQSADAARPRSLGRPAGLLSRLAVSSERQAILTRTVELDVIPFLLRAHGLGREEPAPSASMVQAGDVALLVELALAPDEFASSGFVAAMQEQGFRMEALYLDLLTPVAARLGEMWVEDLCDFTEVTVALGRLQRAMRRLSAGFGASPAQAGRRAVLAPLRGEQHTFGISMVLEFFRHAGWNACSAPVADSAEVAALVRADWVDVVGLSMGCEERLDTARAEIRAIRSASCNPAVAVMIGGPAFVADPGLALAVGADGTASDGREAVQRAAGLVARAAERR